MTTSWTIQRILEATGGVLARGSSAVGVEGVTIDSRRLQPGEAFVAIRGARFDGHQFLDEIVRRGAACSIVSQLPPAHHDLATFPTILVPDTTAALGHLARFRRRQLAPSVIAVTGSCGKTTTKELIAHLLGGPDTVLKTFGTQNNHIGVPLTLLRMQPDHQVAVVELGSNHPGEIGQLAAIAEPQAAVITNVGPVHLEFFGSLMGVLKEKLSLLDAVPSHGFVVLPGDQLDVCLEAQRHLQPHIRTVTFGTTDRCDLQAFDIQRCAQGMVLRLRDQASQWTISLVGAHNVENALAALACVWTMGVPLSVAKERLRSFRPIPLRSEILRCHGLTILNDCYNANPLSVARALETFGEMDVRRKVAIIGDMLELGPFTSAAHEAIGQLAAKLGIEVIIPVGTYAEVVAEGVRRIRRQGVTTFRTAEELIPQLPAMLQEGDGLLVKGSRKLHLETVTEFLVRHYPDRLAPVDAA